MYFFMNSFTFLSIINFTQKKNFPFNFPLMSSNFSVRCFIIFCIKYIKIYIFHSLKLYETIALYLSDPAGFSGLFYSSLLLSSINNMNPFSFDEQ